MLPSIRLNMKPCNVSPGQVWGMFLTATLTGDNVRVQIRHLRFSLHGMIYDDIDSEIFRQFFC